MAFYQQIANNEKKKQPNSKNQICGSEVDHDECYCNKQN